MKRIFYLCLIFLLLLSLAACNDVQSGESNAYDSEEVDHPMITTQPTAVTSESIPSTSVTEKEDQKPQTAEEILNAAISNLPDDRYVAYEGLHGAPVSAVLYKGGEVISIDPDDPRLVKLVNFYNDSVYNRRYAYTQGLLNIQYLEEKVFSQEYRLVLTFDAKDNDDAKFFDTNIEAYDTIVVTNTQFVLIDHDRAGYKTEDNRYPYMSVGHSPLESYNYAWLDIFGF